MTSDKKMTVTTRNFSDTLSKQWFTSDVLIATLKKYSDYTNQVYDMCQTEGILASEAMDRLSESTDELGKKSFEAAQQSKTFKDSLDATKDAVSSQWMHTFQYILGNIDEAIALWTKVTEVLWDVFAASGETRNEILKFWHDNGGRSSLLSAFQNLYDVISAIADIADQAFKSIIPPMTGERLVELTQRFENFTLQIKNAIGFIEGFKDTVQETIDAITGAMSDVNSKWSGMTNFFRGIFGGNGVDMFGNFFGNLAKGNVSGLSIAGLVAAAFLTFGRFGWLGKIAGAMLGMMLIGNNSNMQNMLGGNGGQAQQRMNEQPEEQRPSGGMKR